MAVHRRLTSLTCTFANEASLVCAMATTSEIQERIAAAEQLLLECKAEGVTAQEEIAAAVERQRLRRELERVEQQIESVRSDTEWRRRRRHNIDNDLGGPHRPNLEGDRDALFSFSALNNERAKKPASYQVQEVSGETNVRKDVIRGDHEWKITGMSWLVSALKQADDQYLTSSDFEIGGQEFHLCYHPRRLRVGLDEVDQFAKGSLVIKNITNGELTCRHSLFIKHRTEGFKQWGETGHECFPEENTEERVYGPDVGEE